MIDAKTATLARIKRMPVLLFDFESNFLFLPFKEFTWKINVEYPFCVLNQERLLAGTV